jgi:hypothetical protein
LQYYYDASGKIRLTFNSAISKWLTLIHDGNGQQVKRIETQGTSNTNTYYLRSTVLGGKIITELNQSGQKQKGYIFAGEQLLALQQNNSVTWQHEDPLTGSHRESTQSGQIASMNEPDPMGVDVGFADPYINCCVEPTLNQPMPMLLGGFDIPDGRCTLDGIAIDCAWAGQLMESGAVAVEFLIHDQSGWRVEQSPIISFGVGIFGFDTPTIRRDSEGPYLGWQKFVFSFAPQNPPRILDRDEVSTLVDEIRRLFSARPGCEEWTNKLLGELANATGFNAGNIEDILSSFKRSGVIVSNGSVVGTGGGSTGTALGYPAIDLTFGNTPQYTVTSLLHEIIHWAGLQSGRSLYDDAAQATAWNKLGVVMSAEQYRANYPEVAARNKQRDGSDYAESRLAGAAQDIACLDSKPAVRILK